MTTLQQDEIIISDLHVRTIIGINDWERTSLQDVIINATLYVDISTAGNSDDINDTVDYKAITKRMIKEAESNSFYLIEKLLHHLAAIIIKEYNVNAVTLQIDKPQALRFSRSVGIKIHRTKDDL